MIEVENLWKSYGKLQVLKGLSLKVIEGETLVILGRSGVGKSVLLRQIIAIERPDKGVIKINGEDLWNLSSPEREKKMLQMGMLFQGAALFDSMNIEENAGFYLSEHPDPVTGQWLTPAERKDRVAESLEVVGLPGVQKKLPSELSGGMRKRAALARLITYRPKILLYDEPTTGLDPVTAMQINELINHTKLELKATSIVVTHDLRSAMEIGDRLAFHHDGVIAQIAKKEDFVKIKDSLVRSFFEKAVLPDSLLQNGG